MNQNNFDRAKEFFLKAVQVDARCYQAYDQLITNSLLDPDEGTLQPHSPPPLTIELALLNNLDFQGIPAECRDFIRLIYLTKLNKVTPPPQLNTASDVSTNTPTSSPTQNVSSPKPSTSKKTQTSSSQKQTSTLSPANTPNVSTQPPKSSV